MLENLRIKNFRMLADFQVEKLGKVNLIVGKNNSGKSSVLEALRIYAARGNPRVLLDIAASHDEITSFVPMSDDTGENQESLPFKDFFHGRKFPSADNVDAIYIGDNEKKDYVTIDHTFFSDEYEKIDSPNGEVSRRVRVVIPKATFLTEPILGEQALIISVHETLITGWIPLNESLSSPIATRRSESVFWERAAKEIPVSYVPTQFMSVDYLAQLWDSILFTPYAEHVKSALRILDDNFEDLAFIKTTANEYGNDSRTRSNRFRPRTERSVVIKLKASPKRIPLSSMGDGMLRVLQLALTIFPAKGGILLIDEFENGLHWSVQEKIWETLFTLATDLNIQVFATTHSDDAVKAFSNVSKARPDVGVMIKLVRKPGPNSADETIAVVYDEETLQTATETETEVR